MRHVRKAFLQTKKERLRKYIRYRSSFDILFNNPLYSFVLFLLV